MKWLLRVLSTLVSLLAPQFVAFSFGASAKQGAPTKQSAVSAAGPLLPSDLMGDARAANAAFEHSNFRRAESIYEAMRAKAPHNVYVLSNLGVIYFRDMKWKQAEESLRKAVTVAPRDVFSYDALGIIYYQEQRYADSIDCLNRALAIKPDGLMARNYLSVVRAAAVGRPLPVPATTEPSPLPSSPDPSEPWLENRAKSCST